nr:lantibiotic dehydratase [Bailinhaonella thermotolerans]
MPLTPLYQHAGLVLVRATTDPGDLHPPRFDLSDPAAIAQEGLAWLTKLWSRSDVRRALTLASPALAARAGRLVDPDAGPATITDVRRAIMSSAAYLLRWQRRPTPFGLFAGLAAAAIGPATATIGTSHEPRVRPDAEWLTRLIDQIEQDRHLRERLAVVADNTGVVRGGRLIVARCAPLGSRTAGPLSEVHVRLSPPVRYALDAAATPIVFEVLAAQMVARFPGADPAALHDILHGLIDHSVLITSLRPPMTAPDPCATSSPPPAPPAASSSTEVRSGLPGCMERPCERVGLAEASEPIWILGLPLHPCRGERAAVRGPRRHQGRHPLHEPRAVQLVHEAHPGILHPAGRLARSPTTSTCEHRPAVSHGGASFFSLPGRHS